MIGNVGVEKLGPCDFQSMRALSLEGPQLAWKKADLASVPLGPFSTPMTVSETCTCRVMEDLILREMIVIFHNRLAYRLKRIEANVHLK